ncbi:hypothetical protein NKF26_10240 [Haladaptatus sp. AB618]|uniref:hypothetical protein n=1 Tax=Haladaptatus sp. AB618 TaxID=2934173 RepID=UPI00209C3C02|nr:hypothetical protein [Haladaptatus sp. AB618]MCO8254179.1 hypothetical protein [Haladaptatus sp. AB618]
MMADTRTGLENLTLKAVTYATTPAVVLFIGLVMASQGRVREGFQYVGGDWRQPV